MGIESYLHMLVFGWWFKWLEGETVNILHLNSSQLPFLYIQSCSPFPSTIDMLPYVSVNNLIFFNNKI